MSSPPDSDAELMRRVKQGDREAFAGIVDRYKQPIFNLVHRTIGQLAEAEDLTQQTFVQAYKAAHRYRENARMSTWLFTIARNLCLNELRRRSRHPADSIETHTDSDERPALQIEDRAAVPPSHSILRSELEQKVQEAINELPPNQRIALLLCREEELSYEEMAKILDCSLSATKSLIHRARETVKERLKAYLRSGTWDAGDRNF
jgi:RNA polymerase sigma-70 factor (ECF subfamily)